MPGPPYYYIGRAMNTIFNDILGEFIEVYIDDVVLQTKNKSKSGRL